jgi:glucose-6-phosphate 1-dehydrogenase
LTKANCSHRFKEEAKSKKLGENSMDVEKFLELTKKLDSKKKGKKEEVEKFQKFFERFHLLNRAYLDKETFEKAQASISSMAEAMANTVQYLDAEIARLRNKRMKLPLENVELGELQKIQTKNEMLLKDFLADKK